jgi:hypothetical protein
MAQAMPSGMELAMSPGGQWCFGSASRDKKAPGNLLKVIRHLRYQGLYRAHILVQLKMESVDSIDQVGLKSQEEESLISRGRVMLG